MAALWKAAGVLALQVFFLVFAKSVCGVFAITLLSDEVDWEGGVGMP